MELSTFALYGIVEAIVLLLVVCAFLLMFVKRGKAKNRALQLTLQKLLVKHKALQHTIEQERLEFNTTNSYKKQINDQLQVTKDYHQGLGPGPDIKLDLSPDSTPERRTAAIRHAVLLAEKEALNASSDGSPNWEFLQTKFQHLIQFYVDISRRQAKASAQATLPAGTDGDGEAKLRQLELQLAEKKQALESLQQDADTAFKRVENMEKFKQLYFEMEKQWQEARSEAELYYQRLQGLRDQVQDADDYDNLLHSYHNVYSEFELTLHEFNDDDSAAGGGVDEFLPDSPAPAEAETAATSAVEIMSSEKQALEELKKLRNLTADQHRLITRLQKQLDEAESIEAKQAAINELTKELDKQINYVRESEACIHLLENELENATTRVRELEAALAKSEAERAHVPKMQSTIQQFAHESKEMLINLTELERMNEELRANLGDNSPVDDQALVAKMHAQLQTLQGQYAELEERYLDVKMSG